MEDAKKYHYFYIIVNKVNRKFYYGVHSTNDLNDGYMGSGLNIKKAIKKYGVENFKKTILGFFDTRDELMTIEREFVNEQFLESHKDECYNMAVGGDGGVSATPEVAAKISKSLMGHPGTFTGRKHSPETIEKMRQKAIGHRRGMAGMKHSPESIEKMRKKAMGHPGYFTGRKHSPETIEKMRQSALRREAAKRVKKAEQPAC